MLRHSRSSTILGSNRKTDKARVAKSSSIPIPFLLRMLLLPAVEAYGRTCELRGELCAALRATRESCLRGLLDGFRALMTEGSFFLRQGCRPPIKREPLQKIASEVIVGCDLRVAKSVHEGEIQIQVLRDGDKFRQLRLLRCRPRGTDAEFLFFRDGHGRTFPVRYAHNRRSCHRRSAYHAASHSAAPAASLSASSAAAPAAASA